MKQSRALCVASILLVTSLASADKDKKYTLDDLKALVQQKSFQEALDHLGDIAPSERKADWQDLAGQVGVGVVGNGKDALTKLAVMIGVEQQYPVVLKHAKYMSLRTELGPKGFDACWADGDTQTCLDYATKFIDDDAGNGKLALAIAKIGRRNMNAYSAIPLFKRALVANKGTAVCKDDDFKLAVTGALGLPPDFDNAVTGRELATTCWSDLRKGVMDELAKEDSGAYFKANTCQVAPAKKEQAASRLCVEKKE